MPCTVATKMAIEFSYTYLWSSHYYEFCLKGDFLKRFYFKFTFVHFLASAKKLFIKTKTLTDLF